MNTAEMIEEAILEHVEKAHAAPKEAATREPGKSFVTRDEMQKQNDEARDMIEAIASRIRLDMDELRNAIATIRLDMARSASSDKGGL